MDLTLNELIETAEAFKAKRANPKLVLECYDNTSNRWVVSNECILNVPYHRVDFYPYRIKPTPKKRLLQYTELPSVFWMRRKAWINPTHYSLCIIINDKSMTYGDGVGRIDVCSWAEIERQGGWMFSCDRKTNYSFFVNEPVGQMPHYIPFDPDQA